MDTFQNVSGSRREWRGWLRWHLGVAAISVIPIVSSAAAEKAAHEHLADAPQISNADFERSDRFLLGKPETDVRNGDILFQWADSGHTAYYRSQSAGDTRFVQIDCDTGRKTPLFDHRRVATAPEAAPKVSVDSPSPDGHYAVASHDYNLWLRDKRDGTEKALTRDGVHGWSYGRPPESSTTEISDRRSGEAPPAAVLWAPDSRRFVSYRLDERRVPELTLVQNVPEDGSFRPKPYTYRYDMVGDPPALAEYFIYDLATGTRVGVKLPPLPSSFVTLLERSQVWWSHDSRELYMVASSFGEPVVRLLQVNAESGAVRVLLEERADTTYFPNSYFLSPPSVRVLSNGDIIWYSERTDWGHLYLYDGRTGKLRNAITSGAWLVRDILRVDERQGYLYFSASGREPGEDVYNRHLYRVRMDGSGLKLLTPEQADHDFPSVIDPQIAAISHLAKELQTVPRISPDGRCFIDHFSTPEAPGHWLLRRNDGSVVAHLADEDPSSLPPYTAPEPFVVMSADGRYRLYGVLSKPPHFDPSKRYPVIDDIYPGPQIIKAPKGFASGLGGGAILGEAQALADLGFVVIQLDGRGGAFRSKSFRDLSYQRMEKAGFLEDHIAGLRQLGQTRPWLDLDRVGIFGTSGGGFATAHALLDHPDFFKVGVASAGNHEQRSYLRIWGETYEGPPDRTDYDPAFAGRNAGHLAGRLLLAHGDMDDNVHPANTMRLVDSLIKSNKQFDMLIMPNVNHGIGTNPYFQRIRENYFLRYLMGAQLPSDVDLVLPGSGERGSAN